jgi:hypothetical protein
MGVDVPGVEGKFDFQEPSTVSAHGRGAFDRLQFQPTSSFHLEEGPPDVGRRHVARQTPQQCRPLGKLVETVPSRADMPSETGPRFEIASPAGSLANPIRNEALLLWDTAAPAVGASTSLRAAAVSVSKPAGEGDRAPA